MSVKQDMITQIEIDESGKLHIKPEVEKFSLMYRTATEVHGTTRNRLCILQNPENGIIYNDLRT